MDKIPDISKLTWPLNVSIMAAVFSIFALIYAQDFIYYGLVTFLFGIGSHFVDAIYQSYGVGKGPLKPWRVFFTQGAFMALWILILLIIYT